MLSNKDFSNVIELTPLISIDMIIEYEGKYLIGKRINNPAKDYYFVPGGRIKKNETLEIACERLTQDELGFVIKFNKFQFHVNTQHIYDNNFFNNEFKTHYVCLCYKYALTDNEFKKINIDAQHSDIKWLRVDEILANTTVHENTKNYFHQQI